MKASPYVVALLTFASLMTACKKSVDLPDPELEKLFGSWEWIYSSGGFSGGLISPASAGYSHSIDIRKVGTLRRYKNGKLYARIAFTISDSASYDRSNSRYIFKYNSVNIFGSDQHYYLDEGIRFYGNDTLELVEQGCADCYQHIYVRSKE